MARIPFPENPSKPVTEASFTDRLRIRLVNHLHLGRFLPGDRLPSIRALARDEEVDHRIVAQAYRTLESEGLVAVRGRSGVFVAERRPRWTTPELPDHARWLSTVLAEAWSRSIATDDLHSAIFHQTDGRLRCACVESNQDQMTAYCAELRALTRMTTEEVWVSARTGEETPSEAERERLRERLRQFDVVITTGYHAVAVDEAVQGLAIPVVVLRVHPALAAEVRARLRQGHLTVVAASEEFGRRMRLMYQDAIRHSAQIRLIVPNAIAPMSVLPPNEPIILTRAARAILGDVDVPMLYPHSPTVHPETLRELAVLMVQLNVRQTKREASAPHR